MTTRSSERPTVEGPGTRWSDAIAAGAMPCHDRTLSGVAEDLALDEAMLIEADSGRGPAVVRFWERPSHAVVLGASRRIREDVDVDACRADGVPIFRRSSGGGTVVIGPGALNVTVVLPEAAGPGLSAVDAAQRHVLDRMAASIRGFGPEVGVFGHGDLVLGDRKCAGSAQRRLRGWFLVHCSILYDFDLGRIERYLKQPGRQPDYRRGRPHREFVDNLGLPRRALVDALRPVGSPCDGPVEEGALRGPMSLLPSLLTGRFADAGWIERL